MRIGSALAIATGLTGCAPRGPEPVPSPAADSAPASADPTLSPAIAAEAPAVDSGAAPAAAPAAHPAVDPAPPVDACARQKMRVREETCGDAPEDECGPIDLRCAQSVDFDGDGKPDTVRFANLDGDALGLRVTFGDGHTETLGAAPLPLTEYGNKGDTGRTLDPDLSWIVGWKPAPRRGKALAVGRHTFTLTAARGDGLWITGSDAAAILVLTRDGWLVVELGY